MKPRNDLSAEHVNETPERPTLSQAVSVHSPAQPAPRLLIEIRGGVLQFVSVDASLGLAVLVLDWDHMSPQEKDPIQNLQPVLISRRYMDMRIQFASSLP
jgi:hypothetical protein